jgi:superfamily I DNA/RNA helicase
MKSLLSDITAFDAQQEAALAVDLEADGVAVLGASGSGKTTTLLAHIQRSLAKQGGQILVMTTVSPQGLRRTLQRACSNEEIKRVVVCTPLQLARMNHRVIADVRILDRQEAFAHFESAAAPLLATEWPTIISGELNFEVSGLRYPERFLQTSFALMMKLLASNIDPLDISPAALRATTQFYARPPNFADAELLRQLKEEHRSSLRVDDAMLDHQRKREIDLTRIVTGLFRDFAERCEHESLITQPGYVRALTAHFLQTPAQAEIVRRRYAAVVIDDAQDILQCDLAFLKSVWGDALSGVMLAGDIHAGMLGFQGAKAQDTLSAPLRQIILHERRRGTKQTVAAQQKIYPHPDAPGVPEATPNEPGSLILERCPDSAAQADAIASFIGDCLNQGTPLSECAVVVRTLRCAQTIIEALLAHDIPVDCAGDLQFEHDAVTLDFIALLWCIAAPKQRPDAVLRVLSSPLLRLSDRSVALLCAPARDPMLFAAEPSSRGRNKADSDKVKQFLDNVLGGLTDQSLSTLAQTRLHYFREFLIRHREGLSATSLRDGLIDILNESAIAAGSSVRARFSRNYIARVIGELSNLSMQNTNMEFQRLLTRWESMAYADTREDTYVQIDTEAVCVASVLAMRSRAFDAIAVADARAGAFPRYFVPEAMLYSPQRGFVARENAGSVTHARTAKFTWYFEKARVREAYNSEERRSFSYILGRARKRVFVSAWGSATRGKTAPEFLEELRRG